MSESNAAKEKLGQASGQVQEKAQPAMGQAREKAEEVRAQAGSRLREQVDNRSTQAGEQVQSLADAVRSSGEQLRSQGQERPAKVVEQAAERAERLGAYLRESDADRILGDLEDFARRQPWLVAVVGAGVGFFAARFLKASSRGGENGREPTLARRRSEEGAVLAEPPLVTPAAVDLPAAPVDASTTRRGKP